METSIFSAGAAALAMGATLSAVGETGAAFYANGIPVLARNVFEVE